MHREMADEIANEAVDAFSKLHPHIRMNVGEWADLREMIQREVLGHLQPETKLRARDLFPA